jgi:hypothetical protein
MPWALAYICSIGLRPSRRIRMNEKQSRRAALAANVVLIYPDCLAGSIDSRLRCLKKNVKTSI